MNTPKKGFWRGFTWKKFLLLSLYWFTATLAVAVVFDYFDQKAIWAHNFTFVSIIKRLIGSLVSGFFFALWIDKYKINIFSMVVHAKN